MATIVKHKETGKEYVLVGTGFGAYKAAKPNWFFGNLVPDEESGDLSVVAVCNADGNIGWFPSEELRVVSVDGKVPEALL